MYQQGHQQQQHGYQQQPDQQQGYQQQGYQQQGYQQQPQQSAQPGGLTETGVESGSYQGLAYTVKHRNTSSLLTFQLGEGQQVHTLPGSLVHMSPSVQLHGTLKVSLRKMFTGGQMDQSTFTGPGTVAIAPVLLGDIHVIGMQPGQRWNVSRHAYLARTSGVEMDTKAQRLSQTFFGGDGLFVFQLQGQGNFWLHAYGALDTVELRPGEQHIVEHGHLVAWNCDYTMEKAGSGGVWNMIKTQQGAVCRLTGPGTVYYSTRNLFDFENFIREHSGS